MLKIFFAAVILFFFVACNNNNDDPGIDPTIISMPAPQPITFTVDSVYPHDKNAFTQGLQFYNGKLYEGTGDYENSSLRIVNIKTGIPEKKYMMGSDKIFGEGITIFNNKIYQLTWQNNKIFEYNINDITHQINTLNWKMQGWGITSNDKNMIISDGSDKLYYVVPDEEKKEMKTLKIISVVDNRGMVDSLNELEYINGYVYANRWYTNEIVKIDTANGHVVGRMDLAGLLKQYAPNETIEDGSVLNGIAYDSSTKKLYITGKRWPRMFEMKLN